MLDTEELRSLLELLIHHASHTDLFKFAATAATLQINAEDPEIYQQTLQALREVVTPSKVMRTVRVLQTSGELASELTVEDNLTIAGLLKEFVLGQGQGELPPSRLRLLLNGQVLPSNAVLRNLDFSQDNSLQLVRIASDSIVISQGSESWDKLLKLSLLGDAEVGKTAFIERYCDDSFTSAYTATIGVEFKVQGVLVNGDLNAKLQIWDIAGHERFRQITTAYYRGCHGFVMFFSLTSRSSFLNLPHWLQTIENYSNTLSPGDHPKILIGTKVDLADRREVSEEEAHKWAAEHDLQYFEVSSREDVGVKDAMHSLVSLCLKC
jgi:small GTP-binding protein